MSGIAYTGTSTGGQIVVGGAVVATIDSGGITSAGTLKAQPAVAANDAVVLSQAFGVGQTWQDVSASRTHDVTYTNTTGKPIFISISKTSEGSGGELDKIRVNGYETSAVFYPSPTVIIGVSCVVPAGATYLYNPSGTTNPITWAELR